MKLRLLLDLVGFAVLGGMMAYRHYFRHDARVKRALRKLPRRRLAGLVPGSLIKIVGRLDYAGEPVVAPLSERTCAWYELAIEELRGSGASARWEAVVHQTSGCDFAVRSGRTAALVRASEAEIAVHKDEHIVTRHIFENVDPELEAFLERFGQKATGTLGLTRKLRITEGVLEAGEHVAVCGAAMRHSGTLTIPAGVSTRELPVEWVFARQGETAVQVSDDPAVLFEPPRAG